MALNGRLSVFAPAIACAAIASGLPATEVFAQTSPVPGYSMKDLNIVAGNLGMNIVPCEIGAPEFVAAHAQVFKDYRRRHADAIAFVEKQRDHAAMVNSLKSPQGIQQARGMAAAFCNEKAIPGLVRFGRPADPRFHTPKGAWDFLRASFDAANRAQALLVVSRGYDTLVNRISTASDQELRMAAVGMGELETPKSPADRVQAIEKTKDGKQRGVEFESVFGEWYVTDGVDIPWAK